MTVVVMAVVVVIMAVVISIKKKFSKIVLYVIYLK